MPDLVSVVIPTYNALEYLDTQLEALAAQDYSGDFEVIVSDNGSTDGLRDHLENHPLAERLRLKRIDSSAVQGAPHARNAGAAAAHGEFLVFCDADDKVSPGWLSALVGAGQDYDSVSGPVETTTLNTARVAEWRPVNPPEKQEETPGFLPFGLSGNFGIWRTVFDQVGGFDESLNVGEDVDMSWRIQLAGFTLGHVPAALVAYRLRDSYGALWRQTSAYGAAGVQLYRDYRWYGVKAMNPLHITFLVTLLVVRNPLVPKVISRISTGRWIYYAASFAGRIRGCVKYRTYYI
ncbi:glycosyltransferase [Speluncibacter jeojiensis]|uniref:Glycosyltransferase n=1 Tax=Speluncibacter jeojiensis TaxID=2710754 RepID=A0A9X4RHZ0_9ACTN|nr:glycosyltransferase [Corynebacteriales bacterium D3-21]